MPFLEKKINVDQNRRLGHFSLIRSLMYIHIRAAFRILLKGGGKIAVFTYQGGQALHAVHYNIYSILSRGGGGGGGGANITARWGECPAL